MPTTDPNATAAGHTTAQPGTTSTPWELPSGVNTFFSTSEGDRLTNENDYYVWSVRMRRSYQFCELWEVVSGIRPRPSPGASDEREWLKMDNAAIALLLKCIDSVLVTKVASLATSHEAWSALQDEFSQTGSGSLMLWFRRLTKQFVSGSDINTHVNDFNTAVRHLANADFVIESYISAAILLSTLPYESVVRLETPYHTLERSRQKPV